MARKTSKIVPVKPSHYDDVGRAFADVVPSTHGAPVRKVAAAG